MVLCVIIFQVKPHEEGYIKCNNDCSFDHQTNSSKATWILRDSQAFYLEESQSIGGMCHSPLVTELKALLIAMHHVWSRGYQNVVFKGNNKNLTLRNSSLESITGL